MLVLSVIHGPQKGRIFRLADSRAHVIVGRRHGSLRLGDDKVSRSHAELVRMEGRWFVNDLASTNGTYLNGQLVIETTELRRGDRMQVGSSLLLIKQSGDEAAEADDAEPEAAGRSGAAWVEEEDPCEGTSMTPAMCETPSPAEQLAAAKHPRKTRVAQRSRKMAPMVLALVVITVLTVIGLAVDAVIHPG